MRGTTDSGNGQRRTTRRRWRLIGLAAAVALPTTAVAVVAPPVVAPEIVSAHEDSGYYRGSSVQTELTDWMRDVPDDTYLSDMSIPGTHDSGADQGDYLNVRTQSLTIDEQLRSGIRFFDIRANHDNDGEFRIFHGCVNLDLDFEDVMDDFVEFLDEHDDETIIMRLKYERGFGFDCGSETSTDESFTRTFESYMDANSGEYGNKLHGYPTYEYDENPQLGELRGKIYLFQDWMGTCGEYGPCWPTDEDTNSYFDIQDEASVGSNWGLYDKWRKVKAQLHAANDSHNGRGGPFYVNFLSANSTGVTPYFIASGHSDSRTNASRLSTGRTTVVWGSDHWEDFPHTVCATVFTTDCTISFEGTNTLTKLWLNNKRYKNNAEGTKDADDPISWDRVGIVVADFPGDGLIREIVEVNPVALKPGISIVAPRTPEGSSITFDVGASYGFNDPRRLIMTDVPAGVDLPSQSDGPLVIVALDQGELWIRIFDVDGNDLKGIRMTDKREADLQDIPGGLTVAQFKDRYVVGHVGPQVEPGDLWFGFSDERRRTIMEAAAQLARHTYSLSPHGLQFAFPDAGLPCPDAGSPVWTTETTVTRHYPDDVDPDGRELRFRACARDSEKRSLRDIAVPIANVPPRFELPDQVIGADGAATFASPIVDPGPDAQTLTVDWDRRTPLPPEVIELGTAPEFSVSHVYDRLDGLDVVEAQVTLTDDDGGSTSDVVRLFIDRGTPFITIDDEDDEHPNSGDLVVETPNVTLSGLIGGCADDDPRLTIEWGDPDATSEVVDLAAGTDRFSADFEYPGNGTNPAVLYEPTLTLECGAGTATLEPRITVLNPPPLLELDPKHIVGEVTPFLLTGSIGELRTSDGFTVEVDWGDGSEPVQYPSTDEDLFDLSFDSARIRIPYLFADDRDVPINTPLDRFDIAVTVTDGDGGEANAQLELRVANIPPQPTIIPVGNPDGTVTVSGMLREPSELDPVDLRIEWGDGSFTEASYGPRPAHEQDYSVTRPDPYDRSGTYPVTVIARDDDGGFTSQTVLVEVSVDGPDILQVTGDTIGEGETATIAAVFTDPTPGETFTIEVDWGDGSEPDAFPLPAGPTIFERSHLYRDDPDGASEEYEVTVTITDAEGNAAVERAVVTVRNLLPRLEPVTATEVVSEGESATVEGAFSDPGADAGDIEIDWDDGEGPQTYPYAALADPTEQRGFSESRTYLDDGLARLRVTVVDDDGGRSIVRPANVSVENVAPTTTAEGDTIEEGGTATITGVISDPGSADTHTIAIDWGDGSTVGPPTDAPSGPTEWSRQHVYDAVGTYTVTVTVTDDDGGATTTTTTVEVANVAPSITSLTGDTIDEGGTATVSGEFTDPTPGDTFTVTIDWGEGDPVAYDYDAGSTGFSETHRYADDDPTGTSVDDYEVAVTIADDDGGSDSGTTTVTVGNVDPEITATGTTVEEGSLAAIGGTLSDVGTRDTFLLDVDWGDGTTGPTQDLAAATTDYAAEHVYHDVGTYTVAVTVTDDDTGSASATAEVVVTNVAPSITSIAGGAIDEDGTATVSGEFTDPGAADTFTVTIDWGEGAPVEYSYPAGSTAFSETHQYLDDNPTGTPADEYEVVVAIADDDGGSATASATVSVFNVAPTIAVDGLTDELGRPVDPGVRPVIVHLPVDLGAQVADVGSLDTHTAFLDWGDGTVEEPPVDAGTIVASHAYGSAGTHPVVLMVTDDDTGAAEVSAQIEVLDACGVADIVADRLRAALADADAASSLRLRLAISQLVGSRDGRAANGACDHLENGNAITAMFKFGLAVDSLIADGPAPADDSVELLTLASKSVAVDVVQRADDNASRWWRWLVDAAREQIAAGDAHLHAGDHAGALERYTAAVVRVRALL